MKKYISISLIVLAGIVLLASCRKRDYYDKTINEEAIVSYISENLSSPFIVVKMLSDEQYAVVKAIENDATYWPEFEDIIFGNFDIGTRDFTNRTFDNNKIRLEIIEFTPYRDEAIEKMYYYENQDGYFISSNKLQNIQRSLKIRKSIKK